MSLSRTPMIFLGFIVLTLVFGAAILADRFLFVDIADETRTVRKRSGASPDEQAIKCITCKEPIRSRADLSVLGRYLVPFHRSCARAPGSLGRSVFLRGFALNRMKVPLIAYNLLFGALVGMVAVSFPDQPDKHSGALALWALGNYYMVGLRLVSFVTIEKRIEK